jgi:carbohydrate diacid regulator
MDFNSQKEKLLEQLNKACGINFEITDSELSDEEMVNKLKEMVVHFNVIDSKTGLYRLYLTGELAYSDAVSSLHRFHIEENVPRQLFYLESQHDVSKEAISMLKSMLPTTQDVVIQIDNKHILVVLSYQNIPSDEDVLQNANEFLDMLEAEAFTAFKLSYTEPIQHFKDMPEAYKAALIAMRIGNTFQHSSRIYCYEALGLSRLLYNIPRSEVEAYLNKHINIDLLSQIDEETLNLLETFFDNDLSLAETSRKTFIHRNTLIYRLDKFADMTGYDVRKFSDAITVKISLMLYNFINSQK